VPVPSPTKCPWISCYTSSLFHGDLGFSGFGDKTHAGFDGRRTVAQRHAVVVQFEACAPVLAQHRVKRLAEHPLEIVHPAIVPAELILERQSRDESRLGRIYPVQALRKPCVDVERHGTVR